MGAGTGAEPDVRYARGVAAYARIFGVPEDQLAAALVARGSPATASSPISTWPGATVSTTMPSPR